MFIETILTDGNEVLINLTQVVKFKNEGPQKLSSDQSRNVVLVVPVGASDRAFRIVMEWDELLKIITEVQNEKNQVSH